MMRCRNCGWRINVNEEICPKCGNSECMISEHPHSLGVAESQTLKIGSAIDYKHRSVDVRITINGVKQIFPSFILYHGTKCKGNESTEVEIAELFFISKDRRDSDGTVIERLKQCADGRKDMAFYEFIIEAYFEKYGCHYSSKWPMMRQIFESYGDEYGLDENFIIANGTKYYVKDLVESQVLNIAEYYKNRDSGCCHQILQFLKKIRNKLRF